MPHLLCHYSFKYLPDSLVKGLVRTCSCCLNIPLVLPKEASLPGSVPRDVKSLLVSSVSIKEVSSVNIYWMNPYIEKHHVLLTFLLTIKIATPTRLLKFIPT